MSDPKPTGRPILPPKRLAVANVLFKDGCTMPDGSTKYRLSLDTQIGKVDKITYIPDWRAIEIVVGTSTIMVGFGVGVSLQLKGRLQDDE